jgi:hypothetical protein
VSEEPPAVVAAVHRAGSLSREVARLRARLADIERALAAHMRPETDPCAKGGEAWPCHIAAAVEPDTSILEFLASEEPF